jgi:hypothetical protein
MTVEIEGIDRAKVIDLLEKQNNEELFKYLIITQCNALNQGLPYMFEKISNWTELLFPSNLLRTDSIIGRMVTDIPEEDFANEVEIIGWLYQFYISEKHEEVIDPLHGKIIKKEDIPAATQLFTTDWVVRYILDNSLGRYWIERHPESQLASKLTYLVTPKDGSIETVNETISPEELKVPSYVKKDILQKNGIEYVQTTDFEAVMPTLDVLYMTRVQKERFFNEEDYLRLKDSYILTPEKMAKAKEDLIILHPLPRVNEISVAIDNDPRACYFKQVYYGKIARMSLILKLLEVRV